MKGILADVNIEGYVDLLMKTMRAEPWKLFWDDLHLQYLHFADVNLVPTSLDSQVWDVCQQRELILITDNRNQNDSDSLEAVIRTRNISISLPVITIANVPHLRQSRAYADCVIDKLLDFLTRMDTLRGTGRLYLPLKQTIMPRRESSWPGRFPASARCSPPYQIPKFSRGFS